MAIERLPEDEVLRLWLEDGVSGKRALDLLSEEIVAESAATNPRYAGRVFRIVLLRTPRGHHV